ncbi:dienelactone hydrolase family protein [Curvibacter sp. APW13]|uniref:dienelactone hydrolase family protein n=1 Tax=Curvibacter sp. APW13 TaxID=3077236 RepID=UPI0028DE15E0|nr:dienelactone hydrolase family protein [Curvibacter sp. APW13]MDT8991961.1 dienelactone hydrolase family protein [Curvibacter sp. APW13]
MKPPRMATLTLALTLLAWAPAQAQTPGAAPGSAYLADVNTRLVTYALPAPAQALRGMARLQVPTDLSSPAAQAQAEQRRVPAVVIVHGTGGMDAKGPMYAQALNAAGIATLEVDLWSPRNLAGGWDGRPRHVKETLPDAFGALAYLAQHPRIDAQRIGIMGFSWGGVVSMLSADKGYAQQFAPEGQRFAAHMPYYPICFGYNRVPGYPFKDLTGAPIYILTGADDKYDNDASMCQRLAEQLPEALRAQVKVKVYPNAEHGFNNLDAPRTYLDPFHYQGKGGLGGSTPNAAAREDSVLQTVTFFRQNLLNPPGAQP